MKKILMITMFIIGTVSFAQNKNAKVSLEVDGVCLMCKARIEKACLGTKGVKSANWDVKTHELKLYYDERKTDLKTIEKNIVAVGHDTKNFKANEEVYNNMDPCCHYRDEAVVDAHQDGKEPNHKE